MVPAQAADTLPDANSSYIALPARRSLDNEVGRRRRAGWAFDVAGVPAQAADTLPDANSSYITK